MVQRSTGEIEFVGDGGMPIGLIEAADFGTTELELAPGDRLLLYTDGFTEQTDPEGRMLDEDGLAGIARDHASAQGNDFFDALVWALTAFSGDAEFDDDLSGVLVNYSGSEAVEEV